MRRRLGLLVTLLLASSPALPAAADPPAGEPAYPLDAIPRAVSPEGEMRCPEVGLVDYRGTLLRYKPVIWVNADFRARLEALERAARDTAVEIYGRGPERIVQLGGYGCRRMREHPGWLSEHGLGNAIDVEGFDFGHLARGATLPPGLDPAFANGFEVRVQRHWAKKTGHAAVHARFLRALAVKLIGQRDAFRVLLGPGYPGHQNHFHFDMAPFRMVQIFEDGALLQAPPAQP